jgi:hypothetical protein
MATRAYLFITLCIVCTLINGCHTRSSNASGINFKDTIYKTEFLSIYRGDTLYENDTIWFKPIDFTIHTSQFHYGGYRKLGSREYSYEIYFQRELVLSYCDSILKALPLYNENDADISAFNDRVTYNYIKNQASNNKMDSVIYADEAEVLLDGYLINQF